MSQIYIELRAENLARARWALEKFGDEVRPCIARAINRSIHGIKTDSRRYVRTTYNIPAKAVMESFTLVKATRNNLSGGGISKGSPISLVHFSPRPGPKAKRRPPEGVSVLVMGKREVIKTSFWAKGAIYARTGPSRFPIKKLFGPSVPQMLGNEGVAEKITQGAQERFAKNLEHELKRFIARMAA